MSEALVPMKKDLEKRLGGSGAVRSLRDLIKKADMDGSLLLVDVSGSMSEVMRTGERKIDALRAVVADVRASVMVPTAAFGMWGGTQLVDDVPEPSGSTPLHDAISFGRAREAKHLVVISDGMPDSTEAAMEEARKFGGRIDAIYVGDDGGPGAKFMAELAALTGGSGSVGDLKEAKQLASTLKGLLGDGQTEQKGAIQL